MRIRISGTSKNCPNRLICYAIRFYASRLMSTRLMENLHIHVVFTKIRGSEASIQWMDRPNKPKRLRMHVHDCMAEKATLVALAHEMVHGEQYAAGRLKDYVRDESSCVWEGEKYAFPAEDDPDYWFSPWELEASGMQLGLYDNLITELNSKSYKFWRS